VDVAEMLTREKKSLKTTVKLYTAESPNEVKQEWVDPDTQFADENLVVVFSPTVTVGIDVQVPFKQIFVHAGRGGCCPRAVSQMTGRFRNVDERDIITHIPENHNGVYNDTSNMLDERLDDRREMIGRMAGMRLHGNGRGDLEWTENRVSRLYKYRDLENTRFGFGALFRMQTRVRGGEWRVFGGVVSAKDIGDMETKAAKVHEDVLTAALAQQNACLDLINGRTPEEQEACTAASSRRMKRNESESGDHMMVRTHATTRKFSAPIESADELKFVVKHARLIHIMAHVAAAGSDEIMHHDMQRALKAKHVEHTLIVDEPAITSMTKVIKLLLPKLKGTSTKQCLTESEGAVFKQDVFMKNETKLREFCRKGALARNGGGTNSSAKNDWEKTKAIVAAELEATFGMKIKSTGQVRKGKGARERMYTLVHKDGVLEWASHYKRWVLDLQYPPCAGEKRKRGN